ncbi:MAG: hypothetical protein FWF95_03695 [Syntrophorhabdaceae bacterium]|nr:hypothetical protein [Syntrophorhabdaceae bacterium]
MFGSVLRIVFLFAAVGLSSCGRFDSDGVLSVNLAYSDPAASWNMPDAESRSELPYASVFHNPVSASYELNPSNRILIRVLGPGFSPIEAWFERSEGRGVIRGVPPGTRISVEVDEYRGDAPFLGTRSELLGRGWTRGITLSPGEDKTVGVVMHAKGTIVTICGAQAAGGHGVSGDSGDGGLSSAAKTRNPSAVKSGPDDSIYFSSAENGKVKRIDRYGYVSNFAGNGGFGPADAGNIVGIDASSAPVGFASDIDVDRAGNIYLSTYSNQIIKISDEGEILKVMYDGKAISPAGWDWFNLAVVSSNLLFFVNHVDSRVYFHQISDLTVPNFVKDGALCGATEPFNCYSANEPSGITYASESGSLIIADTGNNRIMQLNLLDSDVRYLVADDVNKRPFSEGVAPLAMAPVKPRVVDYNPITGKIFFVEEGKSRVLHITSENVVRTFAGNGSLGFSGDGGPATEAQLYDPRSITVDSRGNVYIADYGNHAIRMVVGGALP